MIKRLLILVLVLGLTSPANAAVRVVYNNITQGKDALISDANVGDVIEIVIGLDAMGAGGCTRFSICVDQATDGVAEVLGNWMLPPPIIPPPIPNCFVFGDGTLAFPTPPGDYLKVTFTVPATAACAGVINVSYNGAFFGVTPHSQKLPVAGCACLGDADNDGVNGASDMNLLVMKLFYYYSSPIGNGCGPVPEELVCMDLDCDGQLCASDVNLLVMHLFYNGGTPTNGWSADFCYRP